MKIELDKRYRCRIEYQGSVWEFEFTPQEYLSSGSYAGGYLGVDHSGEKDEPAIVLAEEFVSEA